MITVPKSFHKALSLMMETKTGGAIAKALELSSIICEADPDLLPYGKCVGGSKIKLKEFSSEAQFDTNKACVLAHELTHCLDCTLWNKDMTKLTDLDIGRTEINAHFNQGLVANELMAGTASASARMMIQGSSTFAESAGWKERLDAIRYLASTKQYGPMIMALEKRGSSVFWLADENWVTTSEPFHSEQHFERNTTPRE